MNNTDRTVISTRRFHVSIGRMFSAWTDPDELKLWWGPKGFTNTFHQFDLRPGGAWKLTMHGPDGTDYPNESIFVEIIPNSRLIFDHLSGHPFRTTVVFEEEQGEVNIIWSMTFEDEMDYERSRKFVTIGNEENLDRLERHLYGEPFVIERIMNAPSELIWKAITEKDRMKEWYFDLAEFKAEVGFTFQFSGGPPEQSYTHHCMITEVIPGKKLTYSWRYEGYEGISFVTFDLTDAGETTTVRLTHSGLGTFPKNNPHFAKKNFEAGWTDIIGRSLKEFSEKK